MARLDWPIVFMPNCRQAGSFTSCSLRLGISPENVRSGPPSFRAASTISQRATPSSASSRASFTSKKSSTRKDLRRGSGGMHNLDSTHPTPAPTPTPTTPPPSIWTAIKVALGGQKPPTSSYIPAPFNVATNPYRAHKVWPPDFTTLHPKHQLRYEKSFRRRSELKWARPQWKKATYIFQFALTVVIVGYWTFFLDIDDKGGTAYNAFRKLASNALQDLRGTPVNNGQEADTLSQPGTKQNTAQPK